MRDIVNIPQYGIFWVEMDKVRPAVIVSNNWYQETTGMAIVMALTSQNCEIRINERDYGCYIIPLNMGGNKISYLNASNLKVIPVREIKLSSFIGMVDTKTKLWIDNCMKNMVIDPDFTGAHFDLNESHQSTGIKKEPESNNDSNSNSNSVVISKPNTGEELVASKTLPRLLNPSEIEGERPIKELIDNRQKSITDLIPNGTLVLNQFKEISSNNSFDSFDIENYFKMKIWASKGMFVSFKQTLKGTTISCLIFIIRQPNVLSIAKQAGVSFGTVERRFKMMIERSVTNKYISKDCAEYITSVYPKRSYKPRVNK